MTDLAIVVLTPRAAELGRRLAQGLGYGEVHIANHSVNSIMANLFHSGRPVVAIMALGIVVRILGPLLGDKASDPPVVVVDEAGRFAISVLGGHLAGANALAQHVAKTIQAQVVITTASESLGYPPIDLIGKEWGWRLESREHLTRVSAVAIRGEPVGVWQENDITNWWQPFGEWPKNFNRIQTWPPRDHWPALLLISDRILSVPKEVPTIIYRPPTLVLGVGCRRGVSCLEIESVYQDVCRTQKVSPLSLSVVATASLKRHEPGLRQFAALHEVNLRDFEVSELGAVSNLPTPSDRVKAKIGISGVAEPAAMLAAKTDTLLMPKYIVGSVTMALARSAQT